jgi:isoquinoline 1-oxidoreductase subunit alpha
MRARLTAGRAAQLKLPEERIMKLKVNGASRQFDGDPEMPLLWFLRDDLELTGTKYGCGQGLCGACTVHVGGKAARSCQTPMSAVAGKDVVTIEGLHPQANHPVQQAWKQVNAPQCGYCQSGQIMQAAALLKQKPAPTDADIDAAMRGNICRCGTYQRIRQAIKMAAGQKPAAQRAAGQRAAGQKADAQKGEVKK